MSHRKGGGKNHRSQRSDQRRDKARKNTSTEEERWQVEGGEEEEEEEEDADVGAQIREVLSEMKIFLWEFGQNDPKRDSGSKMCRFGYAKKLRVGQSFNGVVLSSEATKFMSPEDAEIITNYGIAGINCSWNRLTEIPFGTLGKARNQRKLPLLLAANTVNYGKPYKMNTAEAIAAGLAIAGFTTEAVALLFPFSFGEEFFSINAGYLQHYAQCTTEAQVAQMSYAFENDRASWQSDKALRKEERERVQRRADNIGGYMDDMMLPPRDEPEYEYVDEEEENDQVAVPKEEAVITAAIASLSVQDGAAPTDAPTILEEDQAVPSESTEER